MKLLSLKMEKWNGVRGVECVCVCVYKSYNFKSRFMNWADMQSKACWSVTVSLKFDLFLKLLNHFPFFNLKILWQEISLAVQKKLSP